jgi:hypothetical protein
VPDGGPESIPLVTYISQLTGKYTTNPSTKPKRVVLHAESRVKHDARNKQGRRRQTVAP